MSDLYLTLRRRLDEVAASVFVLNLFLGWTLIGWVVALAMAARTVQPKPRKSPRTPRPRSEEKWWATKQRIR